MARIQEKFLELSWYPLFNTVVQKNSFFVRLKKNDNTLANPSVYRICDMAYLSQQILKDLSKKHTPYKNSKFYESKYVQIIDLL